MDGRVENGKTYEQGYRNMGVPRPSTTKHETRGRALRRAVTPAMLWGMAKESESLYVWLAKCRKRNFKCWGFAYEKIYTLVYFFAFYLEVGNSLHLGWVQTSWRGRQRKIW